MKNLIMSIIVSIVAVWLMSCTGVAMVDVTIAVNNNNPTSSTQFSDVKIYKGSQVITIVMPGNSETVAVQANTLLTAKYSETKVSSSGKISIQNLSKTIQIENEDFKIIIR